VKRFAEEARKQGVEVRVLGGPDGVPAAPLGKVPVNSPSEILAVTECEWPRVRVTASDNSAEAGPTGVPWVDSNGWVAQLVQARAPGKSIWVCFDPPKNVVRLRPQAYMLAIADAAGYGARWVIANTTAWEATVSTVRFFEAHKKWRDFRPLARLGVLSDFTGDNEFVSSEILNLTSRRHQPFRVLDKTKPVDLTGLVAVIYTDQQAPGAEVTEKLLAFVQAGGLLLIQPKAAKGFQGSESKETHARFRILLVGKGRVAIGKEDWSDPFLTAADAHLLMSHRNDLIRLFNHDSCGSYVSTSPDGSTDLVQLLRYSGRRPSDSMSLAVAGKYRTAKFYTLEAPEPRTITPIPSKTGVDLPLPDFSVYAAVELGK
jgi:hypothetical protein